MESIHLRQTLRPLRYAIIVPDDDLDALIRAVSLNSAIWGGRYNPIVPVGPGTSRDGLLDEFDPDFLVNLTGKELPTELLAAFDGRVISSEDLIDVDHRTKKRRFVLGFNVLPLLNQIYESEIRFAPKETSRACLVTVGANLEWDAFVAIAFGDLTHLPTSDFDFAARFEGALRARRIVFDADKPSEADDTFTPLDLTGYGIRVLGGDASFSSHLIYVGDHTSFTDLVEFWNIRATGRHAWFVPASQFALHEAMVKRVATAGNYPINEHVTNTADVQKGPSLEESVFEQASKWITSVAGPLPRRTWGPRFGHELDWYVGDIHAAELQARTGEEIALLDGPRLTPVKLISPRYFDEDDYVLPGRFQWAVEVRASDPWDRNDVMFTFPRAPAVERLVQRSVVALPEKVRIGREGLVLAQDSLRDSLYLQPVSTVEVFYALLEDAGLKAARSQPGRYTQEIINKLGSLQFDCRVFKLQGVRDVLDRLSDGRILTKGNMKDIVTSTSPGEHGPNWISELYDGLYIRSGQGARTPNFTNIFDTLLTKRIIRPGRQFTCQSCFAKDWYHVSEFGEQYKCRYCFSEQRVPFGSFSEWQYKADGIFQLQDSGFGSIPVILSLWRFGEHQSRDGGKYLSSTKLRGADGWECEIDYAWLSGGRYRREQELVVGQATTFDPFTAEEVQKVRELSDRMKKKAFLAFSTLNDGFSADERRILRELNSEGHKLILFTRRELDPYHLFDRFKNAPHRYAISLRELSENTIALNLAEPTIERRE